MRPCQPFSSLWDPVAHTSWPMALHNHHAMQMFDDNVGSEYKPNKASFRWQAPAARRRGHVHAAFTAAH